METPGPDWPWTASLDALAAAPCSHRLLFENSLVRILEVTVEPGRKEPEHTHRWPSVMIVDRPARIRYYTEGVASFESSMPDTTVAPRVEWLDSEGPHAVENLDSHMYHAIRIEILSGADVPASAR